MQEEKEECWLVNAIILIVALIIVSSVVSYIINPPVPQYDIENEPFMFPLTTLSVEEPLTILTVKELIDDFNQTSRQYESYEDSEHIFIKDIVIKYEYNASRNNTCFWFVSAGVGYEYESGTEMSGGGDLRDICEVGDVIMIELIVHNRTLPVYDFDTQTFIQSEHEGIIIWAIVPVE